MKYPGAAILLGLGTLSLSGQRMGRPCEQPCSIMLMEAGTREPAPEPADADAEERWRQEVATAKARRAARRIRWFGRLAFVTSLFAGLLGGCFAAGHVRGGDSPFSGLDDALERIGIGLLVGLVTGLVARMAIVRRGGH